MLLQSSVHCFFLFLPDDCRAYGFAAGAFVSDLRCGSTAGVFVPNHGRGIKTFFGENVDLRFRLFRLRVHSFYA